MSIERLEAKVVKLERLVSQMMTIILRLEEEQD